MKIPFMILIGILSSAAYAEERCEFKNPNDILTRVRKMHPEIVEAKLRTLAQQKRKDVSKQRPNPKLNAEMLFGNPNSQFATDTFFSLLHTIELGGKRSARMNSAEAQAGLSELEQRNVQEKIIVDAVVKLYRWKQIGELVTLHQEATRTFGNIRKNLKKLPSRSPEQQVEMDTLELGSYVFNFELARALSEKKSIEKHFEHFTECDSPLQSLTLASSPTFPSDIGAYSDVGQAIVVLDAKQDLALARAKVAEEESKKTPNLSIGPAIGYGRSEGSNSMLFGAALSMPLPILNTNQGGRAYADANIRSAMQEVNHSTHEANLHLGVWKQQYQRFYQALQSSGNKANMERKHRRIQRLFRRGVVSTTLVIEAYRQLIDFRHAQLGFELGAVEALWNIYRLTGNLGKGTL